MTGAFQYPWDDPLPARARPQDPHPAEHQLKPKGRRPTLVTAVVAATWLYHHLTISGLAEHVASFAAAARGSGVVPWRLDGAEVEETIFTLAVAQPARNRSLTVEGCRILARQFREQVEARQARAATLVGHGKACPFDLQVLLPIPDSILRQGPNHPAALAWLTTHWGISDRLRQVVVRSRPSPGRRLPHGHVVIGYGFFTAGDTPHRAIAQLMAHWPALRFSLVPRPAD